MSIIIFILLYLQIDFLVNNAGIAQLGSSVDSDLDVDTSVMNINILGTISLTKAVLPRMVENDNGQIVVLSSASGKCGKLNNVHCAYMLRFKFIFD